MRISKLTLSVRYRISYHLSIDTTSSFEVATVLARTNFITAGWGALRRKFSYDSPKKK